MFISTGYGFRGLGAYCIYPLTRVGRAVDYIRYSYWLRVDGLGSVVFIATGYGNKGWGKNVGVANCLLIIVSSLVPYWMLAQAIRARDAYH